MLIAHGWEKVSSTFSHPNDNLERHSRTKLHGPAIHAGRVNGAGSTRSIGLAQVDRSGEVRVRLPKACMIQDILCVGPNLQLNALSIAEGLSERSVQSAQTRPIESVPAVVAKRSRFRSFVCAGVEPTRDALVAHTRVPYTIGAPCAGLRIGQVRSAIANRERVA